MTVTIRVGVLLVLAGLSAPVVGGVTTASAARASAVYGGTLGPLRSPLGPDAFYVTADGAGAALTGIGLTLTPAAWVGRTPPSHSR